MPTGKYGGVTPPRRKRRPAQNPGSGGGVRPTGWRGGKGARNKTTRPNAPRAPAAPTAPDSHKDRFGPISIAPGTNPDVYIPKKGYYSKPAAPGSPSVTFNNGVPSISGSAYNPAAGDDPRSADPNYWKNFYLIQQTANQDYAAALAEQTSADLGYNTYVSDTKQARENARKSFARNLIGTGLLRSGYHNMKQTEADTANLSELIRAGTEKQNEDVVRQNERSGILSDFAAKEYGLYGDAVDTAVQNQMDASQAEGLYGGTKNKQYYNNQIDRLKKKYAKASTPKAKKRIHSKIKRLRKQKNSKYGR